MTSPSVELNNVSLIFGDGDPRKENVTAVDNTSLEIPTGQFVAIVGPSGCGKTTAGRAVLQVYKPTAGDVLFEGQRLNDLSSKEMIPVRRKMQIIFQDPYGSLNPRMTAGDIVGEPLVIHKLSLIHI